MTPKLRREITASLPDPILSFLPGGLKIDKNIATGGIILSSSASFGMGGRCQITSPKAEVNIIFKQSRKKNKCNLYIYA